MLLPLAPKLTIAQLQESVEFAIPEQIQPRFVILAPPAMLQECVLLTNALSVLKKPIAPPLPTTVTSTSNVLPKHAT
jgi:hypothetical protein